MKFFAPKSNRQVNIDISDYLVDWDKEVSKPQKKVKDLIRPYWAAHVVLEEFRIPKTLQRVDIINLTTRVAIEVSPKGSHAFNPFFHKNRVKFSQMVARELSKIEWLERNGFKVVELNDEDLANLSREWMEEKHGIIL